MTEELKKKIFNNEDLLELLLAINFNNKDPNNPTKYEKGDLSEPFRDASYLDIGYYIALLNKWKNSDPIEMLNKAIKENPNLAEQDLQKLKQENELLAETQKGLYKEEVSFLKKHLNKTFLNKAYFVFYDLAIGGCFTFVAEIVSFFYTINKYKNTPIAEELREYVSDVLNEKEVSFLHKDIISEIASNNIDYGFYSRNVKIGIALSEVILNMNGESIFNREILGNYMKKYKHDAGDILEDLKSPNMSEEDILAKYLLDIKNYLRLEELFNNVGSLFNALILEVAKKNGLTEYKEIFTEKDDEKIREITAKKVNELLNSGIPSKERTKDFKNEAVRKIVSIFALDLATKRLVSSAETRETIEQRRREAYKSFNDKEPVGDRYVMSAVNPYSTAIKSLHSKIETYNANNIEVKERALENLNKQIDYLEAKDILTEEELKKLDELLKDQEKLEKELKEIKKRHKKIEKEIEASKQEVKELSRKLVELEDLGLSQREKRIEKRKLSNELKKLDIKINMLEKSKSSRGLYLQLALEEDKTLLTATEDFKGGSLTMFIENTIEGLSKYNREALNLLRYLDGQAYFLPFEKYKREDIPILIDLDNYVAETGRKVTAYKSVREQLIDAVELLQKEYFRVDGKARKYNLDITGKIEIIGDYYIIRPQESYKGTTNNTNKTTLLLFLGHTYKQILFNEKMMQWARVPRLLMKLKDKEIKAQGYDIKKELVQDLGFYIYEEIRRNIGDKSKETKGHFKGYYQLTRYFKTIVEHLQKSNALASNKSNTYVKRVIKPLEEAFTFLADLGLIEIRTKAFSIYYGDKELGEAGLKKASESTIKNAFENAKITIIFKVIDKEAYDDILEKKQKHQAIAIKRKKAKEEAEEQKLLELFNSADYIE